MTVRTLVLLLCWIPLLGCQNDKPTMEDLKRLEKYVNEINEINHKYATERIELLEEYLGLRGGAHLNPSTLGDFGLLRTDVGTFLISIDDVEPYLEGYKLKLKIGNITSATYGQFKLSIEWGPKRPTGVEQVTADEAVAAILQRPRQVENGKMPESASNLFMSQVRGLSGSL